MFKQVKAKYGKHLIFYVKFEYLSLNVMCLLVDAAASADFPGCCKAAHKASLDMGGCEGW